MQACSCSFCGLRVELRQICGICEIMINRSSITATLEHTLEFLRSQGSYLIPAEAVTPLVERAATLLEKARVPGEVLYVGLLGGTGVGKSTVINALAQSEISSASDKRPFTDRAVVYRHRETPRGLEKISHLVRDADATHDSDVIRNLVLLDLPDFDSRMQENRRTLLAILPELDSIVWVASPEKYADAAFYRLIKEIAVNCDNFAFVLNKADQLIHRNGPDAYENLQRLTGDFLLRLKQDAGVDEPRIFGLSAAGELGDDQDPLLAGEFRRFREFLLKRHDAKEIASVKTGNLLEQTRRLLADLNTAVHPEEKEALLASVEQALVEDLEPKAAAGFKSSPILLDLQTSLTQWVMPLLLHSDSSIGPVRSFMKLLTLRGPRQSGAARGLEKVFRSAAESLSRDARSALEKMAAVMDTQMIRAFPRTKGLSRMETPEALLAKMTDTAHGLLAEEVEMRRKSLSGPFSFRTRLWQRILMALPLIVFIIRLSGPDSVAAWLDRPTLEGGLRIAMLFFTSLFGSEGLVGLVVLAMCELIIIWYLASARIKKLEKLADKLAASGIAHLQSGLDSVFDRLREERARDRSDNSKLN